MLAGRKKFKEKRGKERVRARKCKNLDENLFEADVANHNWSHVLNCEDPSECWDLFVREFNTVLDKHAPWKVMYFTENPPE